MCQVGRGSLRFFAGTRPRPLLPVQDRGVPVRPQQRHHIEDWRLAAFQRSNGARYCLEEDSFGGAFEQHTGTSLGGGKKNRGF